VIIFISLHNFVMEFVKGKSVIFAEAVR